MVHQLRPLSCGNTAGSEICCRLPFLLKMLLTEHSQRCCSLALQPRACLLHKTEESFS